MRVIDSFRQLHLAGTFVMPNAWDAGSAIFLQSLGFPAVGTTSAGLAFSQGVPDEVGAITLDAVLANCRDIASATSLPVHADFQEGYAATPEELEVNVTRCLDTGVAGLSIEDASGDADQPLFSRDEAIERIRAARRALDATNSNAILTARCEAWLVDHPEPLSTALDRLAAFAEAGADCLFAPGAFDPAEIREIVAMAGSVPVNVLVASGKSGLTVPGLAEMGVRRVSTGSGLARVAWSAFQAAAREIADEGRFDAFTDAASFDSLNALMRDR